MSDEELQLTAKSWILMDYGTNQYWRGNNTMQKLQIASLTKMYTLQACLEINQSLNIKPQMCSVQIVQSTQQGTQSELIIGKYITLDQIYYAMMLPSGNDASLNLAYYYGYLLGRANKFPQYQWKNPKSITLQGKKKYNKIYYVRFVTYMNEILVKQKLGHSDTHFENPHGMSDKLQRSTAWEIANAVIRFLKNSKFAKIVRTEKFEAQYSDGQVQQWTNTNVLLKQGYIGVKTGHTVSAGSCLCSRKVVYHNRTRYDLVLVVLGCKSLQDRFTETVAIIEDFLEYLSMMAK